MTASPYVYDVYISFSRKDADAVRLLVNRLREAGVMVWIFDWYEGGEEPWPSKMRAALKLSAGAAIIVGPNGLDQYQHEEVMGNIRPRQQNSDDGFRIIPVLLPGADADALPAFLHQSLGVNFGDGLDDEKAFAKLLRAVRGAAPAPSADEQGEAGATSLLTEEDYYDDSSAFRTSRLENFQKGDDISAQEVVHPQGNTVSSLLESPVMGRAPLSKDVRDAVSLAGMMALSANRPVDSTLLLAAILSGAPADQKHAGYSFLTALQAQRPHPTTTTAGPDVVELLGLTEYDLVEIPPAKYSLSRRAEVAKDFDALIARAAVLARDTGSTQATVRVRHVIGAILAPHAPHDLLDAAKRLKRRDYDMEGLRDDFLSHIERYHAGSYEKWKGVFFPGSETGGETPPDVPPVTAPEPTRPEPPTPEEEAAEQESIQQASVSDQPSARDTLGFAPYVKAIATFLNNEKTQPPLTLSIEGEWGSGKSSFMLQLAEALADELRADPHRRRRAELRRRMPGLRLNRLLGYTPLQDIPWLRRFRVRRVFEAAPPPKLLTVEFNPWRHDKENALWASFALEFVRKLSQNMSPGERLRAYLKLLARRFKWTGGVLILLRMGFLVLLMGAFVWALVQLYWADPTPLLGAAAAGDKEGAALLGVLKASGFAGYFAAVLFFLSKFREFVGNPFAFDLRRYIESPDYEGNVAFIEQFHEDFRKIVDTYAGGNKVYVFIDDLDRCDVPKAADLMQAINLMVSGGASQLVFIIGMDREKVAAGRAVKNEKLLPYLAQRSAGAGAKDRVRATDAADAPRSPPRSPPRTSRSGWSTATTSSRSSYRFPSASPSPRRWGCARFSTSSPRLSKTRAKPAGRVRAGRTRSHGSSGREYWSSKSWARAWRFERRRPRRRTRRPSRTPPKFCGRRGRASKLLTRTSRSPRRRSRRRRSGSCCLRGATP